LAKPTLNLTFLVFIYFIIYFPIDMFKYSLNLIFLMPEYEDDLNPALHAYTQHVTATTEGFQKFRLDTTDIIKEIEHHLRGELEKNGEWVESGEPVMNEEGIKNVITIVSGYVNKVWLLSAPRDEELNKIMWNFAGIIRTELLVNYPKDKWEVRSVPIAKTLICDLVHGTLLRCRDGGERLTLGETLRSVERIVENSGKKLFGRRRKTGEELYN